MIAMVLSIKISQENGNKRTPADCCSNRGKGEGMKSLLYFNEGSVPFDDAILLSKAEMKIEQIYF